MMGKSNISYDAQKGCKRLGDFEKPKKADAFWASKAELSRKEKKVEEDVLQ